MSDAQNTNKEKAPEAMKPEADKIQSDSMITDVKHIDGSQNTAPQYLHAFEAAIGAALSDDLAPAPVVGAQAVKPAAAGWKVEEDGSRSFETEAGDRYVVRSNGVDCQTGKTTIPVCGPLEVKAKIRSREGDDWQLLIVWADEDGGRHETTVSKGVLVASPGKVVAMLANGGLRIRHKVNAQGGSSYIANYLLQYPASEHCLGVQAYGWVDETYRAFILPPNVVIGSGNGEAIVFSGDPRTAPAYRSRGTLEEWRQRIARPALYSSRLSFAICFAFAPLLMPFVSEESGGFHLYGQSSKGKSTCSRVSCSVWGPADERGELGTWRNTDNALEGLAASHNNLPFYLDEVGQGDPKKVSEITYMLGNEHGKGRMTKGLTVRKALAWKNMFWSTGEKTLEEHAAEAAAYGQKAKKVKEGVLVRFASLRAEAGGDAFGVFDHLPEGEDPALVAGRLNEASKCRAFGTAGPAFVRALIEEIQAVGAPDLEARLRKRVDQWMEKHCPSKDSQVRRVARRFALVAAAGELAIHLGVLPWNAMTAANCCAECFAAWRRDFKTAEIKDEERRQLLQDRITSRASSFRRYLPGQKEPTLPDGLKELGALLMREEGAITQAAVLTSCMQELLDGDCSEVRPVLEAFSKVGLLVETDKVKHVLRKNHGKPIVLNGHELPYPRVYCVVFEERARSSEDD